MMLVYITFAVLPMILMTAYNYKQTSNILKEKSYQDMQQNMETAARSLGAFFQTYSTIMDLLYTNQAMYNYLSVDYTELSYWDMFYYIDKQLHNTISLIPGISRVSFYSSNKTLPQDNYYFYPKESLMEGFEDRAESKSGSAIAGGIVCKEDGNYIGLIQKMNHYSSGEIENFMVVMIDAEPVCELLFQKAGNRKLLLVDEEGKILAASNREETGSSLDGKLSGWESVEGGGRGVALHMDDLPVICMSQDIGLGMKLFMIENQKSLLEEAGAVSRKILTIFVCSSLFVFVAIYIYSAKASARVGKVVYAARKLGDGEFDYVLEDMGKDEIGQIAVAFNLLNERIQILIRDNYEKKLLVKSSEMNLLQEQINPHFLYNALSVISSMALREGGKRTVESVKYLANFYRISLNKGRQVVSVQEELELLQNYMKIQKIRFEEVMDIAYEVDKEVLNYRTIKLLLQPLVENAIHHGMREEGILHIKVSIGQKGSRIVYTVEDDGLGIEPEKLERLRAELKHSQEGFGLKNVDIRVKLNYGECYGVSVDSVLGKGTCIRVEIPKRTAGQ